MEKAEFGKGMEVEVCSDDRGLRGAWFVATILRSLPRKKKVLVEYHTLTAEESTKPLKELVDVVNIRPIAPREIDRSFNTSDEVDAVHNDGWWEGVVIRILENYRYLVYFRTGKEEHVFERSELRIHREWVHGNWAPPVEKVKKKAEQVKVTDQLQKQDINTQHNQVDIRNGHLKHHLPSEQQCWRSGKNWHCSLMSSPGKVYCEKHQLELDIYNEKRRKNYTTKPSRFAVDPLLPSGQHQCRRTGQGWRCHEMATLGKFYCEKHQLEQDIYDVKRREGKREQRILDGSGWDEIKSLHAYYSTDPKRTRGGEDGRSMGDTHIRCLKKACGGKNVISYNFCVEFGGLDAKTPKLCTQLLSSPVEDHQPFSLCLEVSDSPMNGHSAEKEPAKNDLTIEEMDHRDMLSPTLEEHQACSPGNRRSNLSFAEDSCDDRPNPIETISPSRLTLKNIEHPHSPHEAGISVNFEARGNLKEEACEGTVETDIDKHKSMPANNQNVPADLQREDFTIQSRACSEGPLEMTGNNGRLDDSLKTAEREFNDEKHKFEGIKESITRSSIQLQTFLTDIKMKAEKMLQV